MASPSDRIYFPSLEDCLKGERLLLSWKLVASALSDTSCGRLASNAVGEFLRDAYILSLFKAPTKVFEAPTAQSKSDFESKTAAINVTPTPNGHYDIRTIKDDALWLSKNADISETAALRIVVIEFQSRAQSHLTGPLSSQDLVNLQEAAGVTSAQVSNIFSTLDTSNVQDAETIWSSFETEQSKRRRIFAQYLSERRYFMMSTDYLTTLMLHPRRPYMETSTASEVLRKDLLKAAYGLDTSAEIDTQPFNLLLSTYMDMLPICVQRIDVGVQSVLKDTAVSSEELDTQWTATSLTEITHAMALIFQVVDIATPAFTSPFVVSRWFQLMGDYMFLDGFTPDNSTIADLILPVRCLVCSISLALLNTARCVTYLDQDLDLSGEDAYIENSDVLEAIHKAVLSAAEVELVSAAPVMFAWAVLVQKMFFSFQGRAERRDLAQNQRAQLGFEIENQIRNSLGRRNSAGSIVSLESTRFDRFLADQALQQDIHLVENLANIATRDSRVYEVLAGIAVSTGDGFDASLRPWLGDRIRLTVLDLLKTTFPLVGYRPEPLASLLQVIAGGRQYWQLDEKTLPDADFTVAAFTLDDPEILALYFNEALGRFPLEFSPFAQICQSLSTCLSKDERSDLILKILLQTPSLTFAFPPHFDGYVLANEEDNTNTLQLTRDFPLFMPSSSWRRRLVDEEPIYIPAGTTGRFLTDDSTDIAIMDWEHSALALLGKRLDINISRGEYDTVLGYLEYLEVAEAISLIASLVKAETLKASTKTEGGASLEAGMNVLREASRALSNTKDIVSVICDTLDNVIQDDQSASDEARLAVLDSCIQFLHAALSICPGRVWSYLARSELLTTEAKAGRLSRLTGTSEMVSSRYRCLVSSMKLLSSLIDGAMESSVQRVVGNKGLARKQNESIWLGASVKILEQVSLSIAQTSIDILENTVTWRFSSEIQRSALVQDVVSILNNLVEYSLAFGDPQRSQSLTTYLMPGAKYVIDSFMSSSAGSLRFQPLLMSLMTAFQMPVSTLYQRGRGIISHAASVVLRFAALLLNAINHLEQPSSSLELQLFKVVSLLARMCAVQDIYRAPAFSLMEALVVSAGKLTSEPPSLLGYLGPQISKSFLEILRQLDKPFDRTDEVVAIWKFLSTIIRNRQQWMANCLLTGKTPRDVLKNDGKLSKASSGSILYTAQETLRTVSSIPTAEAIAVLDFFTSAHNYWPWTILAVESDNAYLGNLRAYVRELKSAFVMARTNPATACDQARIAAYIAETFAMQLYHLRQMGKEEEFAIGVIQDVDYFLRDGVGVAGYNTSLHMNFAKNFDGRYPGCSLEKLKRTLLSPRDLGPHYYYALDFAERILKFDPAWTGKKDDGFRHEMRTANLNFSLVDAQIALFHSWEFLLLELSLCLLPKNKRITVAMVQVAEQCLTANQNPQGPEKIFIKLTQARSNLALMLLQRLADCAMLPKDISTLLVAIWTTITAVENPFDPERISYYRTLLKVLYVVLRGSHSSGLASSHEQNNGSQITVSTTQTVLNILDRVVAQGFRTLVGLIHEPEATVFPEDVALITAILQACLGMPGMEQCQTQILNIMASHDTLHVATSLYSWADKLAVNGDPVYGELSLMFLLELSTLPTAAEQLACDGLLGHLVSTSLANHMRRPNVSPFADAVGAQRCYTVWAKAILPMLLNILIALGTTIAPEVAFVLNQFPTLLELSVKRFEAPGMSRTISQKDGQYVTLLAASEVHSLALLTRVLAALRVNNNRDIPEVKWEAGALLENVDFWLSRPKVLRERLLPLGQREAEWRSMKPDGAVAAGAQIENKLEQKVVSLLEGLKLVLNEEE